MEIKKHNLKQARGQRKTTRKIREHLEKNENEKESTPKLMGCNEGND